MKENNSLLEAWEVGKEVLAGKEEGDALHLLLFVTKETKVSLYTNNRLLTTKEWQEYTSLLEDRKKGIPLQYLLGEWEFMGLPFSVTPDVLIPRSDTETLVELVLSYAKKEGFSQILDMCCGSGCIPVSLGHYGKLSVFASDISEKALEVAKKNAARNQVEVTYYLGDLFQAIPNDIKFDIIVSNPPYIKRDDIPFLMEEVREYEPKLALDGGLDGLDFYRRLASEAGNYLTDTGMVFFEIGFDQGEAVSALLLEAGFVDVAIEKDLCGNDRVVIGRKGKSEVNYV